MAIDTSKLKVSDEQLLQGVASSALSVLEYFTKLDAQEDKEAIKSLTDPISAGLKFLNNNGYDPEVVKNLSDNLDLVNTASTNPDYKKPYQDGLAQTYQYGSLVLSILEAEEKQAVKAENEINVLKDNLSVIALPERSNDSVDLQKAIIDSKTNSIKQSTMQLLKDPAKRLENAIKQEEMAKMMKEIDLDKNRAGLQVDTEIFAKEYGEEAAKAIKALGFVESPVDSETGKKMILDEAGIIEGVRDYYMVDGIKLDPSKYEAALGAFNTYQNAVLDEESSILRASKQANDLKIVEVMNEWGVAPSSSTQAHKFQAIMDLVFMDDPSEMLQTPFAGAGQSPSTLFLSESDRNEVESMAREINELRVEYPAAIRGLQTLDLNVKKGYQDAVDDINEEQLEEVEKLDDIIASNILLKTNNVNEIINTWNIGKDDNYKIPSITIYSDISKIKGTVSANKMMHTDVFDRLIYLDEDQSFNFDVSTDEPLIADYKNSKSYKEKYNKMSLLINKYLNSDGSDKRIAEDVWVTKQYSEVFIALLQSMRELLEASPVGKVDATTI
tara:strand:- start:531 stop:2198 length:1668 start_codon:yes stop_codon:yes gene_type:complete